MLIYVAGPETLTIRQIQDACESASDKLIRVAQKKSLLGVWEGYSLLINSTFLPFHPLTAQ